MRAEVNETVLLAKSKWASYDGSKCTSENEFLMMVR